MSTKPKTKKEVEKATVRLNDGPEVPLDAFEAAVNRVNQRLRGEDVQDIVSGIGAENLRAVAEYAVLDLARALTDGQADISDTLTKLADEREGDKELKLTLGFKITWNLDAGAVDTSLSWSVKNKIDASHTLGEPDQPELFDKVD